MRFHRIASHVNVSRRSLLAARLASIILALVILPMAPAAATDPSTIATSSSVEPASATNTVSLLNPVPGARVTSPWGAAKDPWTGKPRHHRGIDLGAPAGTEIVAPADGRVIMATTSVPDGEALGTVIVLDHGDGLTTFYAHLGELDVTEGDRVEAGQVIATVGVTGKTTGPHLHFEVRAGGEPVDPASFIPF